MKINLDIPTLITADEYRIQDEYKNQRRENEFSEKAKIVSKRICEAFENGEEYCLFDDELPFVIRKILTEKGYRVGYGVRSDCLFYTFVGLY